MRQTHFAAANMLWPHGVVPPRWNSVYTISKRTGGYRIRPYKIFYFLQINAEEPISKRNRFSRPNHSEMSSSTYSIIDLFYLVKQLKQKIPRAVGTHHRRRLHHIPCASARVHHIPTWECITFESAFPQENEKASHKTGFFVILFRTI